MTAAGRSVRFTARVLVLDAEDRVLLFRTHWSRRVLPPRWLTVGGGIDPGEQTRDAAARELFEETGRRVDAAELGEAVWHERRPLPAGHEFDEVDSTYFLWRTQRFDPVPDNWMPDEHDDILDVRWFSRDELRATADAVDPEDVARILEMVLGTARPAPGDEVLRAHTKWDGTRHWRIPSTCLGEDEHGWWLGVRVGALLTRPGLEFTGRRPTVMLVPRLGWSTTTFHRGNPGSDGRGLDSYTDIVTPPRWYADDDGWVATATDLDLDVVGTPHGVIVADEDEFDAHRASMAYPDAVVAAARAETDRIRALVEHGAEPFGSVWSGWFDRWAR